MNTVSKRRVNYILEAIMLLLAVIMVIPIYYLLVTTLKTPVEAALHQLGMPKQVVISGYIKAWETMNYPRVFINNVMITISSVVGVILCASLAAYTFARRPNRINQLLFVFILIGVTIPFQVATISLFKLMKSFGIVDTFAAVILVSIFTILACLEHSGESRFHFYCRLRQLQPYMWIFKTHLDIGFTDVTVILVDTRKNLYLKRSVCRNNWKAGMVRQDLSGLRWLFDLHLHTSNISHEHL